MPAEAKPRPRLLYLITSFDGGGAEWGLVSLVRHGAFKDFDLTIAALARGAGAQVADLQALGHRPLILADVPRLTPGSLLRAAWALRRLLTTLRPQVLALSLPHANLLGRLLAPRRGGPLLASFEHNSHLARSAYEVGYRLTSGRVDWMLADCAATAEAAARRLYRRPPARMSVLPLVAFTPERLAEPASGPGGREGRRRGEGRPWRLLSAGRLTAPKNQAHLVAVAAALRRRGLPVELTLCGDGPLRAPLAAQAAELQVPLALPGRLARWWRTPADVFVLASRHEGLCIAALEAMAAGLPVAATAVGGLAEYGPSAGALVLDGTEVEADADRLAVLLTDDARRRQMSQAGRSTAGSGYGLAPVQALCESFSQELSSAVSSTKIG